jgi:hypothetical protein
MAIKLRFLSKKFFCIIAAFLALALAQGCASNDLPPNGAVAPSDGSESQISVPVPAVPTLRPTFQWTAPKDPGVSYDLIVCAGVLERHGYWVPGKTAYYREGLKTTMHTLERALSPDTVYVWSVRSRTKGRISNWAAFSDSNPNLFRRGKKQYNILCPFKTPEN